MMTEDDESSPREAARAITVRNLPPDVDREIAAQARAANRSKSEFLKEFLSASFGDLIGNYMRSDGLVALMDRDVARMMNAALADYWYDSAQTLAENRAWCRLLGIVSQEQLARIMRDGVPLLEIRAKQLADVTHIPHGSSLAFALFVKAARLDDLSTLLDVHQTLFFLQKEVDFLDMVDEMRGELRLPPVVRPGVAKQKGKNE